MQESIKNEYAQNVLQSHSFCVFLLKDRTNRILIALCCLVIVVQLIVFKYFYPYPAFINADSYSYLLSAHNNLKIDFYPIGYPRFLRLFSVFSSDAYFLVAFQYLFMQASVLWLLFSIFYFQRTERWVQVLLLLLTMLSPVNLYVANYISSDSLFFSVSICWFATLIWMLDGITWRLVLVHSALVLVAFMIRYNALYYPIITCLVLFFLRGNVLLRLVAGSLVFVFIGLFVWFTSSRYERLTGERQFSPFSGWQMANNGMYGYRSVDSSKRKSLPPKFSELDRDVRRYFDTTRAAALEYPESMLDVSAVNMWYPYSPLRIYMFNKYKHDTVTTEFKKWATVAPLYKEYGNTLIRTYPGEFIQSYIWPNFVKYYAPPVEFLSMYGYRMDTVVPIVRLWFGFKVKRLDSKFKDISVRTLDLYPVICGTMNAVFVMLCVSFLILGGRRVGGKLFGFVCVSALLWLFNLMFSVFASPVALRFQIFPLVVCIISNLLLLDFVLNQAKIGNRQVKGEMIYK